MAEDRELVLNYSSRTASELLETKAVVHLEKPKKEQANRAKKSIETMQVNPSRNRVNTNRTILRMAIKRSVDTDSVPFMNLMFDSDSEILADMGENILAAFQSESGDLAQLPDCKLREKMECLTGKGQRRPTDLSHVQHTNLLYEIIRRKDAGVDRSDELKFLSIDQSALFMKCDYDAKTNYTGTQDPAISVVVRDVYDVGSGFIIMGPIYRWSQQLICDIPEAVMKEMFYNQPLDGHTDDGTRLGNIFRVDNTDPARSLSLITVSGFSKITHDDCVLAGKLSDIPVRSGMGVSFTFDNCPSELREALSCGGNPCLRTCHGYVSGFADIEGGGIELSICIILSKGNLPSFLRWSRLSQDAVLQTNLTTMIPATWVVSAYRILPITLHTLPGTILDEAFKMGNAPCPIDRNVFIAGQLNITPGAILSSPAGVEQTGPGSSPSLPWRQRYENHKLKAFALLSDFCLLGGAITDEAFKEHAIWKAKASDTIKRVPHQRPQAVLHCVAAFPPEKALSTISASQQLLGSPMYGPYLFDLHSAVQRFAASKAKRAKNGTGSVCTLVLSMPGNMLLQLVHKYATVTTVRFKEGAVEAVVQHFHEAEKLLGSKDGVFNCGASGIIQFFSPITARLVLYNPKVGPEDYAYIGSDGRAEIEFKKYVGMDRHGGELTGEINGNTILIADGDEGGGGGDSGAAAGECRYNQRIQRLKSCCNVDLRKLIF
jgi:hypothetical protein